MRALTRRWSERTNSTGAVTGVSIFVRSHPDEGCPHLPSPQFIHTVHSCYRRKHVWIQRHVEVFSLLETGVYHLLLLQHLCVRTGVNQRSFAVAETGKRCCSHEQCCSEIHEVALVLLELRRIFASNCNKWHVEWMLQIFTKLAFHSRQRKPASLDLCNARQRLTH